MPWTKEDEQEYQLLKSQADSLVQDDRMQKIMQTEGEQMTPGVWYDPVELIGAPAALKLGGLLGKLGVKAASGAASKIGIGLGGKLARMAPEQAELYKKAPQFVESVVSKYKNDPAGLESMAQSEIKTALEKLGVKAKEGTEALGEALSGKVSKFVPEEYINVPSLSNKVKALAEKYNPPQVIKTPTGILSNAGEERIAEKIIPTDYSKAIEVPAEVLQGFKQEAQKAAKYLKPSSIADPITYGAKQKAEAAAAATLRKKIEQEVPDVIPINELMSKEARLAEVARKASKSPTTVLGQSLNKRALAQKLDETGASALRPISKAVGIAKSPAYEPSGLISGVKQGVGRAIIRGAGSTEKALASKPASLMSKAAGTIPAMAARNGAVESLKDPLEEAISPYYSQNMENNWSAEDEQEYQTLKRHIESLRR